MRLNDLLLYIPLCLLGFPTALAGSSCRGVDFTAHEYHHNLLNDYIAVWGGNLSLIESIFHPHVVLYIDRFPSASGQGSTVTNVTNREEFTAFVKRSRTGWKEYYFEPIRSVSADNSIAVRWRMHGVLGSNFTLFETPLKSGDSVTYNGTDFLVQDDRTGQIREAYIAADSVSFFHAMGLDAITV